MQASVFKGKGDHYGFTRDTDGANLPGEFGPWKHFKNVELDPSRPLVGLDPDKAIADIESRGFHVAKVQFTFEAREG